MQAALQLLLLAFAGWFIAGALSIPLYFFLQSRLPPAPQGYATASTALGALCGGFVAGYLMQRSHAKIGLAVGGLSTSIYLLLLANSTGSLAGNSIPQALAGSGVILLSGLGGAYAAGRLQQRSLAGQLFSLRGQPDEQALYHELLAKAGHDAKIVERLVAYERQRYPQASRAALLRQAIQRWERDNRLHP